MAELKRKNSKQDRELKEKLDSMDDEEVVALFNGIGGYIKEHFTEVDDGNEGENGGGNERDSSGDKGTPISRFFSS